MNRELSEVAVASVQAIRRLSSLLEQAAEKKADPYDTLAYAYGMAGVSWTHASPPMWQYLRAWHPADVTMTTDRFQHTLELSNESGQVSISVPGEVMDFDRYYEDVGLVNVLSEQCAKDVGLTSPLRLVN